jgi:flagellar protein FliO/FliZ
MDLFELARMVFALVAVIALIGACAVAARRFGIGGAAPGLGRRRRLSLVETLALDARRRAAILRCDEEDHLVIFGPAGETVVARMPAPAEGRAPAPFQIGTALQAMRRPQESRTAA